MCDYNRRTRLIGRRIGRWGGIRASFDAFEDAWFVERHQRSVTSMTMDDQQLGYDPGPAVPISWTSDQLVRLEHEWRRLQRSFAYHPSVKITPLAGNPPG